MNMVIMFNTNCIEMNLHWPTTWQCVYVHFLTFSVEVKNRYSSMLCF